MKNLIEMSEQMESKISEITKEKDDLKLKSIDLKKTVDTLRGENEHMKMSLSEQH